MTHPQIISQNFSILPCSPSRRMLMTMKKLIVCNCRNVMSNDHNYMAFSISLKETIQLIQKENMNKLFHHMEFVHVRVVLLGSLSNKQ